MSHNWLTFTFFGDILQKTNCYGKLPFLLTKLKHHQVTFEWTWYKKGMKILVYKTFNKVFRTLDNDAKFKS